MADELHVTLGSRLVNGLFTDKIETEVFTIDQAAIGSHSPIVTVGIAEEDLATGDIGTLGWLYLKNLDATNYVAYGPKSAGVMVAFGRIEPGEFAMLRLQPGITIRWLANTAPVKVSVRLYED